MNVSRVDDCEKPTEMTLRFPWLKLRFCCVQFPMSNLILRRFVWKEMLEQDPDFHKTASEVLVFV